MPVGELLSKISSKELTEWMIFYGIEPFGYEADMFGHGIVASTIANVFRKKGTKAVSPDEFIPKSSDNSIDDAIDMITMINMISGGKDKRDGN